jgi:hypothetical protein
MAFPNTIDVFNNPAGTNFLSDGTVDHALQHTNANNAIINIENNLGTNSGTSVIKNFVAGDFATRINSSNILQQNLQGTFNNSVIGTPAIKGGTANNQVVGTPTITGGTANNETLGTPTIILGSDAQGDLYYRSSGGTVNRLGVGNAGQFLKTGGASVDPSWSTIGSSIYNEGTLLSTFTNSYGTLGAGTIILVNNSTLFISANCDVRGTQGDTAQFQLQDGVNALTTNGVQMGEGYSSGQRFINSISFAGTFAAGTHTINYVGKNASSSATVTLGNVQIAILAIPG